MRFIFDFDYTLFNTKMMRMAMVDILHDAFRITEEQYFEAEDRITQEGELYTLDAHMNALFEKEMDREKALVLVDSIMKHADSFLYADVIIELQTLQQHGHELTLLTFGNKTWQSYKIDHTQLPGVFSRIEYVDTSKTDAVDLFDGNDIICVNDRALEIDELARAFPNVTYVWVARPGSPYADTAPKAQHIRVEQVSDISL